MDVYIREDVTVDEFIDVLIGNRRYINMLYVYNKIDTTSMEVVDKIARQPHSVVISCEMELNLDGLKKAIWQELGKYPLNIHLDRIANEENSPEVDIYEASRQSG